MFAFLSPVPANAPAVQAKVPPPGLTPACSSSLSDCSAATGIASGLTSLLLVPAADCPPPCGHRSLCRKAGTSHRRQSIAAIKVRAGCPSGSRQKNQAINKNPPAEPGVFHMTGIALCCWPRVTSRRYDLTPAWSLLLATRKRVV